MAFALVLWALAYFVAPLRLVFLAAAPLALAIGVGHPRDALDAVATFAAVALSLAPLLAHLGGVPTWRQLGTAVAIVVLTSAAALSPWGRILARSDLAPGALTLALAAATIAVAALYAGPAGRSPLRP